MQVAASQPKLAGIVAAGSAASTVAQVAAAQATAVGAASSNSKNVAWQDDINPEMKTVSSGTHAADYKIFVRAVADKNKFPLRSHQNSNPTTPTCSGSGVLWGATLTTPAKLWSSAA